MSGAREAVLFEAVTTPPAGLSARGIRWVVGLVVAASTLPALLFAALGAWPVLGFLGGEVLVVLGMLATHRRWSLRAREMVLLTEARLLVSRADGRGRQERAELEPYWARLDLAERPGMAPILTASARGRRIEIGRFLTSSEKRQLAAALGDALRHYRTPMFDNPVLREG